MRRIVLIALLPLLVFIQPHADDDLTPSDKRLIEALRSYIPHTMKQSRTPGLSISLARHGKVIWEQGFGFADLENKTPMTAENTFRSGSMAKTYTATAVMQLVEQGIIGLHDPVNKYIKDFQVVNPLGDREITFNDLLTHRSGLTNNMAGCRFVKPRSLNEHLKDGYAQKMFKIYNGTVLPRWSAKVGEKFRYSNFGIATLLSVEMTRDGILSFIKSDRLRIAPEELKIIHKAPGGRGVGQRRRSA